MTQSGLPSSAENEQITVQCTGTNPTIDFDHYALKSSAGTSRMH
jgi:hypothetical protein